MLTLEKSKKDRNIHVRLKEQDCFFSKTLLKALALALAFHLGAFIIFQIHDFKFSTAFTFPPIEVHSLRKEEPTTVLNTGDYAADPENFWLNPQRNPSFPSIPTILMDEILPISNLFSLDIPSFNYLERIALPLSHTTSIQSSYQPIQMIISEDLAQKPLFNSPLLTSLNAYQIKKGDLKSYHIKYKIQIDPVLGEIFWYEPKLSSGRVDLDKWVEALLLQLKFIPDEKFEHLVGQIDFIINLEKTEDISDLNNFIKK